MYRQHLSILRTMIFRLLEKLLEVCTKRGIRCSFPLYEHASTKTSQSLKKKEGYSSIFEAHKPANQQPRQISNMGQCQSLHFSDPAMSGVQDSKVATTTKAPAKSLLHSQQIKNGVRETSLALTSTTETSTYFGDRSPSQRRLPRRTSSRRRRRPEKSADPLLLPAGLPSCVIIPTEQEQQQQNEAAEQKEAAKLRARTEISPTNAAMLRRLDHNKKRTTPLRFPSFSSLNSEDDGGYISYNKSCSQRNDH